MLGRYVILFISVLLSAQLCASQNSTTNSDQHIEVSMRMIGHQVLLSLGDSISRVMPIAKDGNAYTIRFESEFGFHPDILSLVIDSVLHVTQIAESYIVEIITCKSHQVAHSYEVGATVDASVLACQGRSQPQACYYLLITLLDPPTTATDEMATSDLASEHVAGEYDDIYRLLLLLGAAVVILIGIVIFILRRKSSSNIQIKTVAIGEFQFNKRKMELSFKSEKIELTSKECDLLQLLFDSANDVVERDTILKMVWDDEGDYVGRTLDVFISKLRKKLVADSNVQIMNIRGVGYKLVVDT